MRYLNPKADLPFYKIFGENAELVISLLNALLPFKHPEEEIERVEYLKPEQVMQNPFLWDNLVNVRCKNRLGRIFIVEIQIIWTSAYKLRVQFNAPKVCINWLGKKCDNELLQPVYSLNLVNDTFSDSKDYYHDFRIVEKAETKEVIEGLRFIFIELPKFTPKNYGDKKMQVLWLRYLTEIDEQTREVPEELLENPDIKKAVNQLEESAFSEAQLRGYEQFWDMVSTAKMQISSSLHDGIRKGRAEGLAEGRVEERLEIAKEMKRQGFQPELIAQITKLSIDEIEAIK